MAAADTGADRSLRARPAHPYVLLIPGMLFTFVFFIVPLITLLKISLSTKPDRLLPNYEFSWEWDNFGTAFDDFGEQLLRSFAYAGIATVLCLLIAYPIAYFIAFKAGRYRNVLLGLVMVPFFTSFLLRTIAWQSLLNDNGPVLGVIETDSPRRPSRPDRPARRRAAAQHPGRRHRRADLQLPAVHAAADLRQPGEDRRPPGRRLGRPVLAVRSHVPQGDPAAVAAGRVRRHPADVHPGHRRLHQRRAARQSRTRSVIGNVVQTQFLERNDYPTAAAISFVLMAIITLMVLLYAKFLGTEDIA